MEPRSIDTAKDASVDLMTLNKKVVNMRQIVRRSRVHIINKLTRNIAGLKKKKGSEEEKKKNLEKAQRYLHEVESLRSLNDDKITKYSLANVSTFEEVSKSTTSPGARALARFADHNLMKEAVGKFREEHSDWRDLVAFLLIQQTGRKFKSLKKNKKVINRVENIQASKLMTEAFNKGLFREEGAEKEDESSEKKRKKRGKSKKNKKNSEESVIQLHEETPDAPLVPNDSKENDSSMSNENNRSLVRLKEDKTNEGQQNGDGEDENIKSFGRKLKITDKTRQQTNQSNSLLNRHKKLQKSLDRSSNEQIDDETPDKEVEVNENDAECESNEIANSEEEEEENEKEDEKEEESEEEEETEQDSEEQEETDEEEEIEQDSDEEEETEEENEEEETEEEESSNDEESSPQKKVIEKSVKTVEEPPVKLRKTDKECVVRQLDDIGSENSDNDSDNDDIVSESDETEEDDEDDASESHDEESEQEEEEESTKLSKRSLKKKGRNVPDFLTKGESKPNRLPRDPFFEGGEMEEEEIFVENANDNNFEEDDDTDLQEKFKGNKKMTKSLFYRPGAKIEDIGSSRGQLDHQRNDGGGFGRGRGRGDFGGGRGRGRGRSDDRGRGGFNFADRGRGNYRDSTSGRGNKFGGVAASARGNNKFDKKPDTSSRTNVPTTNKTAPSGPPKPEGKLHPSWEASRKRKAEQSGGIKAFAGTKITFGDD